MYTSRLENKLIFPEISDLMQQYVSIQQDIDEIRVKAACIIAQEIDIERIIGVSNMERLVENDEPTESDSKLKELIEAPLCYFTYSRLLLSFHSNYTDSGLEIDELATARNEAKSISKEMKGVGEAFMQKVILFLEEENPNTPVDKNKLTPRVRVFGGCETRASN